MAHVIQLALGAFKSSLGVTDGMKSWDAHELDLQLGENASTDLRNSQRLRTEGKARINTGSAMRSRLPKIIETVYISMYFESTETDLHIADNAHCIDYADTWSSK
jgi:hypothetical protein